MHSIASRGHPNPWRKILQFSVGLSTQSTIRKSRGPFAGSSFKPNWWGRRDCPKDRRVDRPCRRILFMDPMRKRVSSLLVACQAQLEAKPSASPHRTRTSPAFKTRPRAVSFGPIFFPLSLSADPAQYEKTRHSLSWRLTSRHNRPIAIGAALSASHPSYTQ